MGRAKKWYAHSVGGVNGIWDELWDNFCLAFFPLFRIADLRIEILTFKQREKETLGAAWARFTSLTNSGPNLSLPDHVLYYHFYRGLNKEAALHLDIASGGSFTHKLTDEGRAILERILENTPYTSIYDEFPELEKEVEPDPKPKDEELATELEIPPDPSSNLIVEKPPDKGMQNQLRDDEPPPLEHPFEFEEDLFEDYGNTSNFPIQTRPLAGTTQSILRVESVDIEHIKSLLAILSYEWLTEAEPSPEVARIITPSTILL